MSEYEILMAMTPYERKVHFYKQTLEMEESWLDGMIKSMKECDEQVRFFTAKAKQHYQDYEEDGEVLGLELAEQYVELAKSTKETRPTLKEIKAQRERVQWHRTRLNSLVKNNEKQHGEKQTS